MATAQNQSAQPAHPKGHPKPDYPKVLVQPDHTEPVPRRIRAVVAGRTVVDTTRATYVWEWPPYPQYYVPLDDVADGVLVDEGTTEDTSRGTARRHTLLVGDTTKPGAALVFDDSPVDGVSGTVRLDWDAADGWYEEDERVWVHPRNPYSRVDAVRSTRTVRVESQGVVLAESSSPVMVFETGLPTRFYVNRTDVAWEHLVPSDTVTACPYKGRTTAYWSAAIGGRVHPDIAWCYDFPTAPVQAIAGLVAFYDEKVDTFVDGVRRDRPATLFS